MRLLTKNSPQMHTDLTDFRWFYPAYSHTKLTVVRILDFETFIKSVPIRCIRVIRGLFLPSAAGSAFQLAERYSTKCASAQQLGSSS